MQVLISEICFILLLYEAGHSVLYNLWYLMTLWTGKMIQHIVNFNIIIPKSVSDRRTHHLSPVPITRIYMLLSNLLSVLEVVPSQNVLSGKKNP
jgi:hypothetical protein